MDNDINLAIDILVKNIVKAIREEQQNTNSTQVFPSIIKSVNPNNTYTILDDSGQERNVKCSIPGLELRVGMNVWVMIPQGKIEENVCERCGVKFWSCLLQNIYKN